jgi:hypothetical protein
MERLNSLAEEFRSSLKEHHEEAFENTTNQDMQREIRDMQALRDVTNNMINMNRLRMFLDGMEELEKLLIFLEFPAARSVMSNVWGAVKFLLKVNTNYENALRVPLLIARIRRRILPTRPLMECSRCTDF